MSFIARNRGSVPRDEVDDRGTKWEEYARLDAEYGPFTVDVAAATHNAKCELFYDRAADGLAQSWSGHRVWCNPPYSNIRPWVEKAWEEHPHTDGIVMLLPANRCEQGWWQDLVEPYRDTGVTLRTVFLPGRMRFDRPAADPGKSDKPPFGCVLLIWRQP